MFDVEMRLDTWRAVIFSMLNHNTVDVAIEAANKVLAELDKNFPYLKQD